MISKGIRLDDRLSVTPDSQSGLFLRQKASTGLTFFNFHFRLIFILPFLFLGFFPLTSFIFRLTFIFLFLFSFFVFTFTFSYSVFFLASHFFLFSFPCFLSLTFLSFSSSSSWWVVAYPRGGGGAVQPVSSLGVSYSIFSPKWFFPQYVFCFNYIFVVAKKSWLY